MGLRYLTAGESHGPALVGILEGMPAGISIDEGAFASLLQMRQAGYGRGLRSRTQIDQVEILSGIISGKTIGSPVALLIRNSLMSGDADADKKITVPLPGHADLPGAIKYGFEDFLPVRERASARETAMRVALSVLPRHLLTGLGIRSTCFIDSIGEISAGVDLTADPKTLADAVAANGPAFLTPDAQVIGAWKKLVDQHVESNRSLGGSGVVIFWNLPIGLGSHVQADRRLDARLASLVMSIPAVKGVEISGGNGSISQQHADAVTFNQTHGFRRATNHCGGIEGGISNGEPLIIRFKMKPLPANSGVASVNLLSRNEEMPAFYRSDVQALAAAAITAESVIAIQLASEILELTGGANIEEIGLRYQQALDRQKNF